MGEGGGGRERLNIFLAETQVIWGLSEIFLIVVDSWENKKFFETQFDCLDA